MGACLPQAGRIPCVFCKGAPRPCTGPATAPTVAVADLELLAARGSPIPMPVYNQTMPKRVIHISEKEAADTAVATLLTHVRAGVEIVIEDDQRPIAILQPAEPVRRKISECIALLPEDSTATVDSDFAKDVEIAVESHREPLDPPAWD